MKVDMYRSAKAADKVLVVPAGTNVQSWRPSGDFDVDLEILAPSHGTVDLERDKPRVAMDVDRILDQIED